MTDRSTAKSAGRVARRKAQTRANILRAAQELFVERGVDAPSIAEIAAAADVSVGAFYLQFKDRDDLVDVLLSESLDSIRGRLLSEIAELPDGVSLLPAAIRTLLTTAYEERQLFALIIAERGRLAHGLQARKGLIEQFSVLLRAQTGGGEINGMNPDIVARMMTGIVLQAGMWWQDHDEPDPEEMQRQVMRMLTQGLPASLFGSSGEGGENGADSSS
jgi:AcrR family transcriptional regulator